MVDTGEETKIDEEIYSIENEGFKVTSIRNQKSLTWKLNTSASA